MGRVKLQIKRLESMNNRQVTYSKRRNGILKKAKELSILCDIDLLLLMFSPTGKPTLSTGGKRMEDILARFLRLTPEEREKRRMESLDTLKKTFKKLDHDINIEEFGGASSNQANQATEELSNDLRRIQAQLSDVKEKLWCYGDEPHQINTIEQAREVETNIQKAIIQMSALKQNLKNQQYIVHDGNNQLMLHGGFCTSLSVEGDHHQAYPTPWMQFENQSVLLPGDPGSLLTQSDTDSLANSNTCIRSRELISGKEPYIEESASSHYTYLCDLNRDVSGLQWPFERASFSRDTDSLANSNTCIHSRELISGKEPYIEESASSHYTYLCDLNRDVSRLQWPFERASFSRDSLANSNTCIQSRELIAGQEPYIEESAINHYTYLCDLNKDVSGLQWPFESASFSRDTDSLANSNTCIRSRELIAGQEPYIEESASSHYTYPCDLNRDVSGLQWPFERASFSCDTDSLANSNTFIHSRAGQEPYIEESASSRYTYLCDLNRDVSGLQWPFERASFSLDQGNVILKAYKGNTQPETCLGRQGYDSIRFETCLGRQGYDSIRFET